MNKRIKLLSLGILSAMVISATPVCAANVHNSKISKTSVIESNVKVPTMPGTEKPSTASGCVTASGGTDLKTGTSSHSKVIKHLAEDTPIRIYADTFRDNGYIYVHCLDSNRNDTGVTGFVLEDDIIY